MTTITQRYMCAVRARLRPSRWSDQPLRQPEPEPQPPDRAIVLDAEPEPEPEVQLEPELPLWQRIDPVEIADDLGAIVEDPVTATRAWIERDHAAAMYLHRVEPRDNEVLRGKVDDLLAGNFRPHSTIPARQERIPPRWTRRPRSTRTEELYRHALTWLEPLISIAHVDDDDHAWQVATDVITSWIHANSTQLDGVMPFGCSPGAWHDHAVSVRVRVFCWFLELYRRRPAADAALVRLIVASIYQHGLFLADEANQTPKSNHELEAAGSLLSICVSYPELMTAADWSTLAVQRLETYVAQAFAADGFSKEQSPRYHFFILRRLAALVAYLDAVGFAVPEGVHGGLERAARVWPWLARDDGTLPRIGDSNERGIPHWRASLTEIGGEPPAGAPSTLPTPREDPSALLASVGGIYAVMRGHHPDEPAAVDTHVVFKTDYFCFPHFHRDGLSFVFYALGREWLIDPGPHSYEYERWERQYLCSSSAHNVVEVGGRFDIHPVEVIDIARTPVSDLVTARHHLDNAVHTRTLEHRPLRQLRIRDHIAVTDGQQHRIRQLFHVAPECAVEIDGDRTVRLVAPTGDRCVITQRSPGTWRVVRGQRDPEPLGWYSPQPRVIAPIATCVYEVTAGDEVEFETHVEVLAAP